MKFEQKPGGTIEDPPEVKAPGEPAESPLPEIAAKADDLLELNNPRL
ncbi:MAG: hypothetical protein ACREDV_07640 [Methylocella sp.]